MFHIDIQWHNHTVKWIISTPRRSWGEHAITYLWGSFGLALSEWSKVFGGAALDALQTGQGELGIITHLSETNTIHTRYDIPALLLVNYAWVPINGRVVRWSDRAIYLQDCQACSSKAFWFRPAPGTDWGCLGTKGFLKNNHITNLNIR